MCAHAHKALINPTRERLEAARAPCAAPTEWRPFASRPFTDVYFMFTVDVPMYYSQWQADEAKHTQYDSFGPGLLRMLTCQDVADDWAGWQEDATWMFLYFGVGPFAARALASSLSSRPAGSA